MAVVELAGARLLDTGTPYLARDAIAESGLGLLGYVPYQPGMALFGMPRHLFGDAGWTDARVLFFLVTTAALAAALAVLGNGANPADLVRAAQAVTVLPVCALTLATGGDDLPVVALCLLAFALATRDRWLAAGFAIGAAGALKLFAWPVAVVLIGYAVTRGRTAATRTALPAFGVPLLALVPPLLLAPGAVLENLVRFPLGLGLFRSPAASPLPGHLLATGVPGGRAAAVGLLLAAVAVIGYRLVRRPPRTAAAAAGLVTLGLLAAILLMPATRFGYLLYPAAFALWLPALTDPRQDSG